MLVYVVVLTLLLSWASGGFRMNQVSLSHTQIVDLFRAESVKSFVIQGNVMELTLHGTYDGKEKIQCTLGDPDYFLAQVEDLLQTQKESGVLEGYNFLPLEPVTPIDYVVPLLVAGVVLLLLWFILMSRATAGGGPASNFGKARTVVGIPDGREVTFKDVAGADEEKQELQEVVDFLRAPEKFHEMGARIPHGILLVGPPGTGKTLLARAVAGEAEVQFLSISGSDFVEMYVGVGASRVRDLFDQAKKSAPAIIFIDEIDAVGRKRGSGLGGGHDEKEQTLNQLLVEMDGFGKTEGVIVLAATNRPDILDPALRRPGRFDREIYVGKPDSKGREDILKVHARDKRLGEDVDLAKIAMTTQGFTGADLQNLLNEAAILATRAEKPVILGEHINEAMMKVIAGPEKRSRIRTVRDQRITAYHEAGHAVVMHHLQTADPVHHITIVPRGRSLGTTWSLPGEERSHLTRNEMFEDIVGLLGGRAAEEIVFRDITTGASNDIDRASDTARDMVARFGMSKRLGTISYLSDDEVFIGGSYGKTRSYSEQVAGQIDEEVKAVIDRAYDMAMELLTTNRDKLDAVAEFLLKHENMTGEQFKTLMEGQDIAIEEPEA
ncbi:MAG: ATP-dependent zinc metalloprotease FtsH [Oscillospiraceae bacterium]|nr:ATP-dependent zinc metalloprotease FtsH [Oscillospiraceae bacterium]